MSLDTHTTNTDAPAHSIGPILAWPGFDTEAAAKFVAPLQAYPRVMMTVYSAWLDAGSELVMSGIAANRLLLGVCRDCWSDSRQQSGSALPAAMLDATREAVARQTEIVTSLQQRLVASWAPVGPDDVEQAAQRSGAEGAAARAGGRGARATPPAQRDTPTAGTRP